jgi:O-antigen ligase
MTVFSRVAGFDGAFMLHVADWLAIAVAVALPWSTSATGICIALWLVVLLPILDVPTIRREVLTAAGGLPVLLWGLGAVGMLWADVGWTERLGGLGGFNRLLIIPLLLAQFRRSERGAWVACGFLISSALVLLVSFVLVLTPGLSWRGNYDGVPFHDYVYQGSAFLVCGFGALGGACDKTVWRRPYVASGLAVIGTLFLVNFALATVGRAALSTAPVLVALFGWRSGRWKGVLAAAAAAVIISAAFWSASPSLRTRVDNSIEETRDSIATNDISSIGAHMAFLEESVKIIQSAPIMGHGTGSIPEQFRLVTAGETGVGALATVNPHNQTFAVAIQIGVIGALVLWSMWIAHLRLFRGQGIIAWAGTVLVVENIVSSIVHTHLFDFANGWLYVFGVGVLGGSALHERARAIERTGIKPELYVASSA